MGQHRRPHALADPPEQQCIPGFDGVDLRRTDRGRHRQAGVGQVIGRDVAAPAGVLRVVIISTQIKPKAVPLPATSPSEMTSAGRNCRVGRLV